MAEYPGETAVSPTWVDVDGYGIKAVTSALVSSRHRRIELHRLGFGYRHRAGQGKRLADAMLKPILQPIRRTQRFMVYRDAGVNRAGSHASIELFSRHDNIDAVVCASRYTGCWGDLDYEQVLR